MILVDANVLLDVVTDDPDWAAWSVARLEEAALAGSILINDIVYAETSIRYERIEELDAMLNDAVTRLHLCRDRRCFWPERLFNNTARPAVREPASCPTSSSARMQPSRDGRC